MSSCRARNAAIADANVHPVPCVLVVSIRGDAEFVEVPAVVQHVDHRISLTVAALDDDVPGAQGEISRAAFRTSSSVRS